MGYGNGINISGILFLILYRLPRDSQSPIYVRIIMSAAKHIKHRRNILFPAPLKNFRFIYFHFTPVWYNVKQQKA